MDGGGSRGLPGYKSKAHHRLVLRMPEPVHSGGRQEQEPDPLRRTPRKLYVPANLRPQALAPPGTTRTLKFLRRCLWWPSKKRCSGLCSSLSNLPRTEQGTLYMAHQTAAPITYTVAPVVPSLLALCYGSALFQGEHGHSGGGRSVLQSL